MNRIVYLSSRAFNTKQNCEQTNQRGLESEMRFVEGIYLAHTQDFVNNYEFFTHNHIFSSHVLCDGGGGGGGSFSLSVSVCSHCFCFLLVAFDAGDAIAAAAVVAIISFS